MEGWNIGILARPGATHLSFAAFGELYYQLIFRRTSSQLGLGQGIMGKK
jgi:hypothetical protein